MGIFNKTIIPLVLVGYEMIIANLYPMRTRGIILAERVYNFVAHFMQGWQAECDFALVINLSFYGLVSAVA